MCSACRFCLSVAGFISAWHRRPPFGKLDLLLKFLFDACFLAHFANQLRGSALVRLPLSVKRWCACSDSVCRTPGHLSSALPLGTAEFTECSRSRARAKPPPKQKPFTMAMIGFGERVMPPTSSRAHRQRNSRARPACPQADRGSSDPSRHKSFFLRRSARLPALPISVDDAEDP